MFFDVFTNGIFKCLFLFICLLLELRETVDFCIAIKILANEDSLAVQWLWLCESLLLRPCGKAKKKDVRKCIFYTSIHSLT